MQRKQVSKHDRLGKYELLELLGRGGMGEVWQARDTQLQRYVAIKLMHMSLQGSPDFVEDFTREARLVAALRHPNIVQLHDFQFASTQGETAQAYMVMDYIEGGTLARAIRGTVRQGIFWSASDIVDLFTAISLALDYAHRQGMVHRDIKPANILLDRSLSTGHELGEPVLTDFGIARWQGGGSTMTGFIGTPLYVSPEQARNQPVDARSDLYSLGIILYEVLTGVTPFRGANPLSIMLQHVEEPPPEPALINPLVSPALSAVVLLSIAKDPRERFPSATAMTIALAQAFNLPVPALLTKPEEKHAPSIYNPLQPQPKAVSVPPAFVLTPPPLTFTSSAESRREQRPPFVPSANGLNRVNSPGNVSSAQPSPGRAQQPLAQSSLQGGLRKQPDTFSRKWLLVVSLGCVLLLLLGLGAVVFVPRFSSSSRLSLSTRTADSGVAGRILFRSDSPAVPGAFNTLQIDLTNVPQPLPGQAYYAWLIPANSEAPTIPHWSLQVNNGVIHDLYTSNSPQTDLFTFSDRFLISTEDIDSTPIVPYPLPSRHIYYAVIIHTSTLSPAFTVRACPTNNVDSGTSPCR